MTRDELKLTVMDIISKAEQNENKLFVKIFEINGRHVDASFDADQSLLRIASMSTDSDFVYGCLAFKVNHFVKESIFDLIESII